MNDHLTKPARLETLAAALQRHLVASRQLSVGVEQLDTDHERIVELLNELNDGLNAGAGREALGKEHDGLISTIVTHFEYEEAEMKQFDYPGAPAHFEEHVALLKPVLEVQAKYRGGSGSALITEVIVFVRAWLLQHIQGSDKALGAFLCAQRAKKSA
jgi:hemerythrin